ALGLDVTGFRVRTDQRRIAGAMRLAERRTAGDQRHGLFVAHRHAEERLADVARRGERIGIAAGAFRVDVDEAHLHGTERIRALALAAVAFVAVPRAFGTPVEFFRLPDIGAAAGETEGLEADVFERDVAAQDEQIGPGNFPA